MGQMLKSLRKFKKTSSYMSVIHPLYLIISIKEGVVRAECVNREGGIKGGGPS